MRSFSFCNRSIAWGGISSWTRLKEKTEAASYAEVIRNALRVFEALAEEHDKGSEFALKRAGGETVAYKIFL